MVRDLGIEHLPGKDLGWLVVSLINRLRRRSLLYVKLLQPFTAGSEFLLQVQGPVVCLVLHLRKYIIPPSNTHAYTQALLRRDTGKSSGSKEPDHNQLMSFLGAEHPSRKPQIVYKLSQHPVWCFSCQVSSDRVYIPCRQAQSLIFLPSSLQLARD